MTQYELLPEQALDSEGYPTDAILEWIKNYVPDESMPIESFVENVLKDIWWVRGFYYKKEVGKLYLSTGGWSGNELIIRAIEDNKNIKFTHYSFKKEQWRRGGHYIFEVRTT